MDINLFNFELPEKLIAQHPSEKRDQSRLLVLDKLTGAIEHKHFFDIFDYLHQGDVLVRNNTKVIPARLFGQKAGTGAHVEVLLLHQVAPDTYECLVGNARVIKIGSIIDFSNGKLKATCLEIKEEGIRILKFSYDGIFLEALEALGEMPLPPYIHDQLIDKDRYQTVYASINGSAAGPTAGFHFTQDLLAKLERKGIVIVDVTLHIGLATFRPVKVKDITDHKMHFEEYEISDSTANALNSAKQEGRRIISVGTTSTRALEANMTKWGYFTPERTQTDIFITPGYEFKAIDAIITNFHLPKSTLIMMMSAFAGRERILSTYKVAIEQEYRFFSFGDAMYIYGK
ncbi:MAG TPA: tRNA preQ1(34) S-adenosylmethionine ribosyltransferase-isomerase QueA [Firmicutes bacterium]|nr:tRNA preQ1(34) S-adenosylmethionine ribosyltransferase-isomerase QueA [Bacillota bacterium]